MRGKWAPLGPRPKGHRVLKEVELSDGRVVQFEVLVIDPPEEALRPGPRKVRPMTDGGGRVSRFGNS